MHASLAAALSVAVAGQAIDILRAAHIGDVGALTVAANDLTIRGDIPFDANFTLAPGILDLTILGQTPANVDGNATFNTISGSRGPNSVTGGGGPDAINGDLGDDTIVGDAGADTIRGESGEDSLLGGGNDTLSGGADNDTLRGGSNNDLLDGGTNDDSLFGEIGQDTLIGGFGDDYLAVETHRINFLEMQGRTRFWVRAPRTR